jgi:hypothetical protein
LGCNGTSDETSLNWCSVTADTRGWN